ncbi:hypothetical protein PGT21_004187 [Puccinia graminis f. sp. tritici]|uniref:Uncharacterized protein n=1 Tax=Puccinia graminis f. sp. tritici TaxID=56615 RepID=A0A5B0MKU9_PUCGR|nr:hypothetical protein PGT21_004187 [Puccinia graminis f. sp. tritici]
MNSQKDSIEKDWQEIIESTRLLEEDAKKVDVDPYYPEQLDTIRQEIDQVNCCQNLLIHIFGAPGGPMPHFVDRPKEAWEIKGKKGFLELYNQSIWSLVSLVKATSENDNLTTGMHHIDINCKKCGFQTLEFIKKYNLAPDLMEEIERFLKSRPGLKWFGDSSSYIFQNESRLDNKFHWDFRNEEHLKFHFHLIHYNKIFEQYSKEEQDWVLFICLTNLISTKVATETLNDETDPEIKLSESEEDVIRFTRKLKEILLKGLENGRMKATSEQFFWDVREDLIKLRKRIIDPKDLKLGGQSIRVQGIDPTVFYIFDFLESRFGFDYVNSDIFEGDEAERVDFSRKCSILKLNSNNEIWKQLLLDYSHYLHFSRMNVRENEDSKRAEEEERIQFYWNRLRLNLVAYQITRIHFKQDKAWNQNFEANLQYKKLIDLLDSEVKNIRKIPKIVKSLIKDANDEVPPENQNNWFVI